MINETDEKEEYPRLFSKENRQGWEDGVKGRGEWAFEGCLNV